MLARYFYAGKAWLLAETELEMRSRSLRLNINDLDHLKLLNDETMPSRYNSHTNRSRCCLNFTEMFGEVHLALKLIFLASSL